MASNAVNIKYVIYANQKCFCAENYWLPRASEFMLYVKQLWYWC